ncbi:unnamed protein product, partial [Oikopleura dioica]
MAKASFLEIKSNIFLAKSAGLNVFGRQANWRPAIVAFIGLRVAQIWNFEKTDVRSPKTSDVVRMFDDSSQRECELTGSISSGVLRADYDVRMGDIENCKK